MDDRLDIIFSNRQILKWWYMDKAETRGKLNSLLHTFVACFFHSYKITIPNREIIYSHYDSRRQDHIDLLNKMLEKCPYTKGELKVEWKYTFFNLDALLNLFRYRHIFKDMKQVAYYKKTEGQDNLDYIKLSTRQRLFIYIRLINETDIYSAMCRLDTGKKIRAFVCLNDAFDNETACVQFMQKKGVKTISAQHALDPLNVSIGQIGTINFWGLPTDYYWAWGDNTKKYLSIWNPELKIVTCGNPLISPQSVSKTQGGYIGVVLDTPYYRKYNQKLIDIAKEYAEQNGKRVRIRVHPQDNPVGYSITGECMEICSDLYGSEFILGHTSTMIFTYLAEGTKVYKLKSSVECAEFPLELVFQTSDDLEKLSIKKETLNDFISQHIKYIGEQSMSAYRQSLENIVRET